MATTLVPILLVAIRHNNSDVVVVVVDQWQPMAKQELPPLSTE
jgi:hypothetical protein